MAVVKTRGATKKLGPIGLGRKVVNFKTRNCDRYFTVHEDLLCTKSKFFKNKLQKDRKAVEGDCSICHEKLDPKVDDVTFCRAKCGQNVHEKCMDGWKSSRTGRATCPMCRNIWKDKSEELIVVEKELDRDAVQLYIDWLYTGKLHIDDDIDRDDDTFNVSLLKAWSVSCVLCDEQFTYAIIAELVVSIGNRYNEGLGVDSINYAYDNSLQGNTYADMRDFVVMAYLAQDSREVLADCVDEYPAKFTQDLCIATLGGLSDIPTHNELLTEYTDGEYEFKDDDDD